MKKIQIKKTNDKFDFYESENLLFSVNSFNKTIDGKDIYEKIYKGIDISKKIETKVDISHLEEDDKKLFGNYVVMLFNELDQTINKKFGLETHDSTKE